jgi:hypothetical protein
VSCAAAALLGDLYGLAVECRAAECCCSLQLSPSLLEIVCTGLHHEFACRCRYENLVQIRCLLEGVDPQDMLLHWHDMLPEYMQRWQLDRLQVRLRSAPSSVSAAPYL